MNELMSRLATQSSVPIMVDTTETKVARAALTWLGGKSMLNSVNLEEGDGPGTRLDGFLTLAARVRCAIVATCIDEEGQARTAEWKVRAARAITELAVYRYGLDRQDIFIDTARAAALDGMVESRRDGIETIEAIRRIKAELPGVRTILGLSNISFGLNPRRPPSAQQRLPARVFRCGTGRRDRARVQDLAPRSNRRRGATSLPRPHLRPSQRRLRPPQGAPRPLRRCLDVQRSATSSLDDLELRDRLRRRIIDGARVGLEDRPQRRDGRRHGPLDIVNDMLLDGMREVGDLFAIGRDAAAVRAARAPRR